MITVQPAAHIEIEKLFTPNHTGHALSKDESIFTTGSWC